MPEQILQTRNITKKYGTFSAVDNLSFSLQKGDIYGLIGQNGAGKTTLLKMVGGLTVPASGELELFGQASEDGLNRARLRIGCMIESPAFFPYLSATENLEYYRIQKGISGAKRVREVLQFVGLSDTGRKKFKDFSMGMKQRLGLALAIMGNPETKEIGMIQSRLTNTDLVWEKKTTANAGFDLVGLNNRLHFSAEYFYSKSGDLLVYLPILMSSGNEGGSPAVNAGSLENRGVEVEIGWNDKVGDFSYSASLNVSHLKNKVMDLGYGQTVYYTDLAKTEIGQPLGMWYLYKMNGIFQSGEEVRNYTNSEGTVIQPNALPGDIKYDDYNDDGIISSDDRQIVGNPWPKLEMGLNLGASYKNFDLKINGYGRFGHDVWNGSAAAAGDFANNQNNFNGLRPWTQEYRSSNRPRIVYGDSRNSRGDQSRWLEDGSFFRLSDITLGYSIPATFCGKLGIDRIRASVTLQNMVTLTRYSGLDPEFADGGIFTIGADNCSFPNPRAVQFALSFTF